MRRSHALGVVGLALGLSGCAVTTQRVVTGPTVCERDGKLVAVAPRCPIHQPSIEKLGSAPRRCPIHQPSEPVLASAQSCPIHQPAGKTPAAFRPPTVVASAKAPPTLPAVPVTSPDPDPSPNPTRMAALPTVPETTPEPTPTPTPNPTPMAARRWVPSPVVVASENPRPRRGVSYLAEATERSREAWDRPLPDPLGVRPHGSGSDLAALEVPARANGAAPSSRLSHLSRMRNSAGDWMVTRWKRLYSRVVPARREQVVPASALADTSPPPAVPAAPVDPPPDAPLLNVQESGASPSVARPETEAEPALGGRSWSQPETAPERQTGWVSALAFPSRDSETRKTSRTSPLASRPARVPIVTRVWSRLRGGSVADAKPDSVGAEAGNLPEGGKSVE